MPRTVHRDNELKPPAEVLVALKQWLDASGLRQVTLVKPLRAHQSRVTRLFAGEAYLSATQRRALEEFTSGAITAAMLEGRAPAPAEAALTRCAPVERAAERLAAQILDALVEALREIAEGGVQ